MLEADTIQDIKSRYNEDCFSKTYFAENELDATVILADCLGDVATAVRDQSPTKVHSRLLTLIVAAIRMYQEEY